MLEKPLDRSENSMNKDIDTELEDELRPEYDFSQLEGGVTGKYVERYQAGINLRGCLRSKKALIGYSLSIDKPTGNESNATILPY
jgi:hypothetical protein